MPKLFVDKTIKIDSPAAKVWQALTASLSTGQWASEFSSGGPRFHIESDWQLGSPVDWKGDDNTVIVTGNVTAVEPNRLLRYTVFDTGSPKPAITSEDGITFELTESQDLTTLHILQGDFSVMPDGQKYCDMSAKIWDRALPIIKKLSEA